MELEQRIKDLAKRIAVAKVNPCHVKSGPQGGQFCETGGGSGGGSAVGGFQSHGINTGGPGVTPKQEAARKEKLAQDLSLLDEKGFRRELKNPKLFRLENRALGLVQVKHTGFLPDGSSRWSGNSEVTRASGSAKDVIRRVTAP